MVQAKSECMPDVLDIEALLEKIKEEAETLDSIYDGENVVPAPA